MASAKALRRSGSRSKKELELDERRMLVLRNMRELMREMGRLDKFDDPDEWLKSIVARPR